MLLKQWVRVHLAITCVCFVLCPFQVHIQVDVHGNSSSWGCIPAAKTLVPPSLTQEMTWDTNQSGLIEQRTLKA